MKPVALGSNCCHILTYSSTWSYWMGRFIASVMSKNASTMIAMNRLRKTWETISWNTRKNAYALAELPQTNGSPPLS